MKIPIVIWQAFKRLPRWGQVITVVLVIGLIGSALGLGSKNTQATDTEQAQTPELDARQYILKHAADAYRVRANIENVKDSSVQFQASPTPAHLYALATVAQQAHDDIDAIRNNFTYSDSGALGDAEGNVLLGANDLKNAMGALVAETDDPTPSKVAHFNTQFAHAQAEWNQGIQTIWHTANRTDPPTL